MEKRFYDLGTQASALDYRWVQPPQVVFLVCSQDAAGNVNVTPVTLGTCVSVDLAGNGGDYAFAFSVRRNDASELRATDAYANLTRVPECVIAYPGSDLVTQVRITATPIPSGISELEVARLTPLASRKVRPPGIQECPVNLEARIEHHVDVGSHFTLFVARILGVSVDEALLGADTFPGRGGLLQIDPLLEAGIDAPAGRPARMVFARISRERWEREPDEVGPRHTWIGSFEAWMHEEAERGRLGRVEHEEILALARRWRADPDPRRNAETRRRITRRLSELVWGPAGRSPGSEPGRPPPGRGA